MESFEPTQTIFSRVQTIDPKNASRIMGYILLNFETDLMRFACGSETLLISIINKAKNDLGLLSNTLSALKNNSISNPIPISKPNPFQLNPNPSSPSIWSTHGSSQTDPHDPNSSFFTDPFSKNVGLYRKSYSFNDRFYESDELCPYYSKGLCKNGSFCKFFHGDEFLECGDKYDVFEPCQEDFLRSKLAHHQRLAAQLRASGVNLPFNKLDFMPFDSQRSASLALMMDEELHKANRARMVRNEFSRMGLRGDMNPASRQIYLTFPSDSTFKEEDVSQYFSRFGPVHDVRIPFQQKRMFGFVTFVFSETVNIILAKGNPHFVCDSRVLVKPYKEKGKLPDNYLNRKQIERAEFFCSSPSGLDSRDPFDFQLGERMSYNTQEMMFKKHLDEQADFQQALELQGRRLVNLQLLNLKNHQHNQHNLAVGSPVLSPIISQTSLNHNHLVSSDETNHEFFEESKESPFRASNQQLAEKDNAALYDNNSDVPKEDKLDHEESELPESLEHALPDSLFASPTKLDSESRSSVFYPAWVQLDDGAANMGSSSPASNISAMPVTTSPLNNAPQKSYLLEMTRLSAEHEARAIEHEHQHADWL